MKKVIFTGSLMVLLSGMSVSVNAALSDRAVLGFEPGVGTTNSSGIVSVNSGSYFGMDFNGNGVISASERIAISENNGLIVGSVQDASGSHSGAPGCTPEIDPSCTNTGENPGIDAPWPFFTATGMHYAIQPTNILSDDGNGNVTLDFSGWGITWNGLERINFGGGMQDCGTADDGICVDGSGVDIAGVLDNGTGIAVVTCALDCAEGDTYTLDYTATAARVDPTIGFGGVPYSLHLEGVISSVPVPAAIWLFGSGLLGLAGVVRRRKS